MVLNVLSVCAAERVHDEGVWLCVLVFVVHSLCLVLCARMVLYSAKCEWHMGYVELCQCCHELCQCCRELCLLIATKGCADRCQLV